MANPSLQIGDSNWAIKEDNLLGYSTAGTRFVPKPITMTRASAGTRVDEDGLVNYAQIISSVEFIDNTNFATDTDWGGSYEINTVSQQLTKTSSGLAYQINGGIIAGTSYKIVVDVASLDGTTTVWVAGNNYNLSLGIQTIYAVGGTNSWNGGRIAINNGYASGAGSVLNSISVKEVTRNNLARVDYTDGTSSLLAEPERTNLVTYSEEISLSTGEVNSGTGSDNTVTDNYGISPDGTQNATRLVASSATGTSEYSLRNFVLTTSAAESYTQSVYLKSNTGSNQNIIFYGRNTGTRTPITVTSEWQRFEITGESNTSNYFIYLGLRPEDGTDSSCDVLVYGLQLEEASYATSYIPTYGTTVTRIQDQYTKTGISNLINSEEGTIFVEMQALANDSTNRYISINDGSSTNRIIFKFGTSSNNISALGLGTATSLNLYYSSATITNMNKIALKYKVNDCALWVNGVEVATDTTFTAYTANTLNQINFSNYAGSSQFLDAKVKQLQIFKTALSDPELVTLTT